MHSELCVFTLHSFVFWFRTPKIREYFVKIIITPVILQLTLNKLRIVFTKFICNLKFAKQIWLYICTPKMDDLRQINTKILLLFYRVWSFKLKKKSFIAASAIIFWDYKMNYFDLISSGYWLIIFRIIYVFQFWSICFHN